MTRNQYILLFIGLAVAALVVFLIIYYVEVKETASPQYIETCESFPNDGVYVPAAYYKLQYGNGYTGSAGAKVSTEKKCNENCKNVADCAGYLYNCGTCYLLDAKDIKKATYYCKHGTGLTVTPNFAEQYRRQVAEPIMGYGYFKDGVLPPDAIVRAPGAWEECLTLRTKTSDVFNTGMAAEKIWTDKSYKIPELEGLDLKNYQQGAACESYCSSLGGYQHPWCYTKIGYKPQVPGKPAEIDNEKSSWGFCTNGCVGYDCFDGSQTPFTPQPIKDPSTGQTKGCTNCVPTDKAEERCGNCQGCLGPHETCPEVAPATWSPTQRANYYCLYPGSNDSSKCCTETNLCVNMQNPPPAYSTGLSPVPGQHYRKKKIDMTPFQAPGQGMIIIPYRYADPQKLAGVCQREANCNLPNLSPGNNWCGPPVPSFPDNPIVVGIENPHQKIDDLYGECNPIKKDTKCCYYQTKDKWVHSALPTNPGALAGMDSYWVTTEGPLVPETQVARSCRTQCTDLNPTVPLTPLQEKWCITDPYYPAARLGGSPISFPINDPDFDTGGSQIDRTFWQWGFCDKNSCKNSLSWPPGSVTTNNYPNLTGQ